MKKEKYLPGFFETPSARRARERATRLDDGNNKGSMADEFISLLAILERIAVDTEYTLKMYIRLDKVRQTQQGRFTIFVSRARNLNAEFCFDEYHQFIVTNYVDANGDALQTGTAVTSQRPHTD